VEEVALAHVEFEPVDDTAGVGFPEGGRFGAGELPEGVWNFNEVPR
jgi:hypothetical protein